MDKPMGRIHMIAMECFNLLASRLPVMRQFPYAWEDIKDDQLHAISDAGKHLRMRVAPNGDEIVIYVLAEGEGQLYSQSIPMEYSDWKMSFGDFIANRLSPQIEKLIEYYMLGREVAGVAK